MNARRSSELKHCWLGFRKSLSHPLAISFEQFDVLYMSLTGHDGACRWQYRLFTAIHSGAFPTDLELGTGLGKTSIIALWAIALGVKNENQTVAIPRRLAFVVNRRVGVEPDLPLFQSG